MTGRCYTLRTDQFKAPIFPSICSCGHKRRHSRPLNVEDDITINNIIYVSHPEKKGSRITTSVSAGEREG